VAPPPLARASQAKPIRRPGRPAVPRNSAAVEHLAQPPVLLGVDLPAGQPLVQDPARVAAGLLLVTPGWPVRWVAPVIRAWTSQISRPQNAIIPIHIRPACHHASRRRLRTSS